MQRRATAAYVALFLVLAAGSYGFIAVAEPPEESMDAGNAAFTLQQGDSLTVNGRTYTASSVQPPSSGSEGSATFTWENESAPYSEVWGPGEDQVSTLVNASVVETGGGYEISFPAPATTNISPPSGLNATNVSFDETGVTVTLSDNSTQTESAPGDGPIVGASIVDNNSRVEVSYFEQSIRTYDVLVPSNLNDTVKLRQQLAEGTETRDTDNGTVIRRELSNGTVVEIPIEEYEPLERVDITTSDELVYRGNATTLSVGEGAATARWNALRVNAVETKGAQNVTLNGQQYFGYFADGSAISLFDNPDGYDAYSQEVAESAYFDERINGFWGVAILSLIAAGFVSAVAYLPRKDT
jgi:hypothetical protein